MFIASAVQYGNITAVDFLDLVECEHSAIEFGRAGREDWLIAHVGPDLHVGGSREPDAEVFAFVEQVPDSIFAEGRGSAEGAGRDGLAICETDIERTDACPLNSVGR